MENTNLKNKTEQEVCCFVPVSEVWDEANRHFNKIKKEILRFTPNVDIQHVGGSIIPGSITKKDLDIQIRVEKKDFEKTENKLKDIFESKHVSIWRKGKFSIFKKDLKNESNQLLWVDVVLTLKNSKYDEFYKTRDFLLENPNIVEKYNNLKKSFEGKSYSEYSLAKIKFWGGNGNSKYKK